MLYQLLNKLKVNDAIHFDLTWWLKDTYYSELNVMYRDMRICENINWNVWQRRLESSTFYDAQYRWNQEVDKTRKVTLPAKRKSPD